MPSGMGDPRRTRWVSIRSVVQHTWSFFSFGRDPAVPVRAGNYLLARATSISMHQEHSAYIWVTLRHTRGEDGILYRQPWKPRLEIVNRLSLGMHLFLLDVITVILKRGSAVRFQTDLRVILRICMRCWGCKRQCMESKLINASVLGIRRFFYTEMFEFTKRHTFVVLV